MSPERPSHPLVILIAPNVSQQMGGEGMKALQIYEALEAWACEVHQVTHDRVRGELDRRTRRCAVSYVEDGRVTGAGSRVTDFRMADHAVLHVAGREDRPRAGPASTPARSSITRRRSRRWSRCSGSRGPR